MHITTRLSLLAAASLACSLSHAAIDLIAIGRISGTYGDFATQTAAPLENGVAGNRLGGIGSGLAWAGGNTFLAIPDRGPNAVAYDSLIDDTTSWIDRFQTLHLSLAPSAAGAALPYVLTPMLTGTTLLSSRTPLVYGSGANLRVGSGAPALNAEDHTDYFSGRSDNFEPSRPSTFASNGRLDPESIRASSDGRSVYISDEYGPYVYQFDRESGRRVRAFAVPPAFAVTQLSPQGAVEIANNSAGRVANKGMEGLALTPDGRWLVGIMQSPLIQDGGTDGAVTRILVIGTRSGATAQFAYPLTNIGTEAKPKYPTVSDIVAINNHEFLVDERDGKGLGDGSVAAFKRLYRIDLAGAAEVSRISGAANLAGKAVAKTLFLDIVAALNAKGIASPDIPAKIEGISFGPEIEIGGVGKHTLYIANDNDFIADVSDALHPNGIENPNQLFVFSVDAADLPGYVPQVFKRERHDEHDGHH